jgi:hypothetical protein
MVQKFVRDELGVLWQRRIGGKNLEKFRAAQKCRRTENA